MKGKQMRTLAVVGACLAAWVGFAYDPVDYVLPEMGTDSSTDFSSGNVYPAIARPWGMNVWSPQTGVNGHGWMYCWQHDKMSGLRLTHQPSPWINDYGSFAVLPVTGKPVFSAADRATRFSHKAELFKPYHYRVYLGEYDSTLEVAPTARAAILRVTYPETDAPYFVIDAGPGRCGIKLADDTRVEGWNAKNHGGVGDGFANHFALVFSEPVVEVKAWTGGKDRKDDQLLDRTEVTCAGKEGQDTCGLLVKFAPKKLGQRVTMRVASSFIDADAQLARNFRELDGKTFEDVVADGRREWNEVLGRVKAESPDFNRLQTFYTCLYRSFLYPRRLYEIDADGQPVHANFNGGKGVQKGFLYGDTVFWDTFRALFPLMVFVAPKESGEATAGWQCTWKENGWLPEACSPGIFPCMIGNNSASIVADACLADVPGPYDKRELFRAMVHGAENSHLIHSIGRGGAQEYIDYGYLPFDNARKVGDSGARTLEYAYADWCIWKFGTALGLPASETDRFRTRASNWKNLWDKESGWMRGRAKDGSFRREFDIYRWGGDFTEGSTIHYSWSVFHDIAGLIETMGGPKAFNERLEWVMTSAPKFDGRNYWGGVIHEMREMQLVPFGQYAHGNQPIQHMLYLWNWSGEPWRSQYWTREVMDALYQPRADGYCGDEDTGQTSAWFVWSALGMYPVCPGTGEYALGSPIFDKVTIRQPNGKTLVLEAPGASREKRYIDKLTFNGEVVDVNYVKLADLRKGGTLHFTMSGRPNTTRGTSPDAAPYSLSRDR